MTLVEVVIGITLMTLIATIPFAKTNLSNYKVNSFINQMTSDLRYVRRVNKLGYSKVCIVLIEENDRKGYVIREKGENIKSVFLPKGTNLECPVSKILFNIKGGLYAGGTTIRVTQKDSYTDITIVPVSGRVLIKEGIYK